MRRRSRNNPDPKDADHVRLHRPTERGGAEPGQRGRGRADLTHSDRIDRVYHGLRNLGLTPQDRAINFAATNAFAIERIYEAALKEHLELESVNAVRSPICRPGSDCWDVEVDFFYPERQVQTVRRVHRFTVDVSDSVPVTVGPTRSWLTR